MSEQQHHYFASCALGWATADTAEAALEKLVRYGGFFSDFKQMIAGSLKNGKGAYVWTCRVDLPESAHYSINFYAPEYIKGTHDRVPVSNSQDWQVTYLTKSDIGFSKDQSRNLKNALDELEQLQGDLQEHVA